MEKKRSLARIDQVSGVSSARRIAGRYLLEGELGRGGMGSVHRASDEGTGRTVALKLLSAKTPGLHRLFQREYRTLAKLAHPCVIRVFDYGVSETGDLYYTMELLGGRDLLAAAPLSWRATCEVLRDVCTSLGLLHAQKLVHRDVNPRNVRLDNAGRAKLLDFGALTSFGVPKERVGTPSCTAPEARSGGVLDARTDLFSLAVVGYWTLTGRLPYEVRSLADAEHAFSVPPLPPSTFAPDIPKALDELLLSLLSIDPLGRPASAAEVLDGLGVLTGLDDESLASIADSHVKSAGVVGRERELSKLHELLLRTKGGDGSLVTLRGGRGSGKTRLLDELSVEAQLAGFSTVQLSACEHTTPQELVVALVQALTERCPTRTRASQALRHPALEPFLLGGEVSPRPAHDEKRADEVALKAQVALTQLVVELAAHSPLLLCIDDVDALTPHGACILPMLAQAALERTLLVAVARSDDPATPGVEQLAFMGTALSLGPLERPAVERLVQETFGDVPHRTRLSHWLSLATGGNPGDVRRALLDLVAKKVISYAGGAWLLPADLSDQAVPATASDLEQRYLELPRRALDFLRLLAVHRLPVPEELCAPLLGQTDGSRVAALLDELESDSLIARTPQGVRLVAHGRLEVQLLSGLSEVERTELHHALGRALSLRHAHQLRVVRQGNMDSLSVDEVVLSLTIGLHLLMSGEERAATEILRNGAVELTVRGEGLTTITQTLEDAINRYRALGRNRYQYGGLMTALSLAGTYADWRLSYRYGEEMIEMFTEVTGLKTARRLAPLLGGKLALFLCMGVYFALFQLIPSRRITPAFRLMLLGLMGLGSAVLGVCTVLQDRARAVWVMERLEPLRHFPKSHPVHAVHIFQRALLDHASGMYAAARKKSYEALAYVRSKQAMKSLPERGRLQLEGGILILLGQLDACRTDGSGLQTIEAIERLNSNTSRQTLAASYATYYGHRGERDRYMHYLGETDRLAAEAGSTWRNDVQVPRMLWSTHALCEDVLTLKRDVEQLRSLARHAPTVARLRDVMHACYLSERGMPDEALKQYEGVLRLAEGERGVRAMQQLGAYARILRRAGRPGDAAQICERGLSQLTEEEQQFTALIYLLHTERALSLAALGQPERAVELIDQLLSAQSSHDNPMLHGVTHGTRAQLALHQQDWVVFDAQLEAMRGWYRSTQNPALFAQCERLAERARALRSPAGEIPVARAVPQPRSVELPFETE